MSRSNVRRLTACLVLAALLGLAVPAAAAPGWPLSPTVHGPGLLDQIFAWIGHLWRGDEPQQAPVEKAKAPVLSAEPEEDRSGALDPNGSC